jgi:hypothetical protein
VWTELNGLRFNKLRNSVKRGEVFDKLSNCQLLKDSTPWNHTFEDMRPLIRNVGNNDLAVAKNILEL